MILLIYLGIAVAIGLTSGFVLEWFRCRGWEQKLLMKRSRAFPLIVFQVLAEAGLILNTSDIRLTIGEIETEIIFRKEEWVKDQIRVL